MTTVDLATKFEDAKVEMWRTWALWKQTRDTDDLEVYAFWTERCEILQARLIETISTGEPAKVEPLPIPQPAPQCRIDDPECEACQ